MVRLVACLSLVSLMAHPVFAQDPAGAEAAVLAYTEAVAAGDWEAAAALTDPADLARLRDLASIVLEDGVLGAALLGVTAESAASKDAFGVLLGIVALNGDPKVLEAMATARLEVIGTVLEGDSLVHVVGRTRMELFERTIETVDVSTARWTGDRWVVGFDDRIEAVVLGMEEAVRENPEFYDMEAEVPIEGDPKKQR